jgi:hypothetical protein
MIGIPHLVDGEWHRDATSPVWQRELRGQSGEGSLAFAKLDALIERRAAAEARDDCRPHSRADWAADVQTLSHGDRRWQVRNDASVPVLKVIR